MKPKTFGWYTVIDDFNNDGTIDISVIDRRDETIVEIECETFESYSAVIDRLIEDQEIGAPTKIKLFNQAA